MTDDFCVCAVPKRFLPRFSKKMRHQTMRAGHTLLSSKPRLSFESQRKQSTHSGLCPQNKFACVMILVILVIICVFGFLYFDVASHSDPIPQSNPENPDQIIIEEVQSPSDPNNNPLAKLNDNPPPNPLNSESIALSSSSAYMNTLNIEDNNFLNLLHRRSLGFDQEDYNMMHEIITEYASYANQQMQADINSNSINGKYITITPAAQMCNRMRAFMGTMLLGILTKRIVFIDIGAEGYAARLNKIFVNPGYEWEFKAIDGGLRARINGATKQKFTFPYEHLQTNKPPSGVIMQQVCGDWTSIAGDKTVLQIESHAAYLPVIARNEQLFKGTLYSFYDYFTSFNIVMCLLSINSCD